MEEEKKDNLKDEDRSNTSNSKKSKKNIDHWKRNQLFKWVQTHNNSPYPSEKQKQDLALRLNLTVKQVNNWFINTRKVSPRCYLLTRVFWAIWSLWTWKSTNVWKFLGDYTCFRLPSRTGCEHDITPAIGRCQQSCNCALNNKSWVTASTFWRRLASDFSTPSALTLFATRLDVKFGLALSKVSQGLIIWRSWKS